MKAGRHGPKISHLMFVDDLLLFGKATKNKMRLMKRILDKLCVIPGQRISYDKSNIIFSKNTDSLSRKKILQVVEIK